MLGGKDVEDDASAPINADQHDTMLAVLDALIELGAPDTAGEAQRIYAEFPVQALILLSRAGEDATTALMDIFQADVRWPAAWLAAGNLLIERRAEGFAAAVVRGLAVHAEVTVTEPGTGYGQGGSSGCCGIAIRSSRAGWPAVGVYGFAACGDRLQPGAVVLAAGTDAAYYNRVVDNSYQTAHVCGCNPDQDLVRQHYLTTLLNGAADQPPVRAHVSRGIVWQGGEAYVAEMRTFIEEQQRAFAEMARRMGAAGLLDTENAKTLRPRLEIRILDRRGSQETPLPAIVPLADNVTVEPLGG